MIATPLDTEEGDYLERLKKLGTYYKGRERYTPQLIKTHLPGLDNVLGGGVPLGYVISIEGHLLSQSGKSGVGYLIAAALQQEGQVLWIDTNDEFCKDHALVCNLDLENLGVCNLRQANEVMRVTEKAIRAPGISCVVIDSLAGLIPREGLGPNEIARLLSERLPLLRDLALKRGTTLVLINQYKDSSDALVGGPSTKSYPQIRLRIGETKSIKVHGIKTGISSQVTSVKNQVSAPFKSWSLNISYDQGPDRCLDIIQCAIAKGIITQQGYYYHYKNISCQGITNLRLLLSQEIDYLYQELLERER